MYRLLQWQTLWCQNISEKFLVTLKVTENLHSGEIGECNLIRGGKKLNLNICNQIEMHQWRNKN